jgi:NAD(P)-dependent dehydrogenase (short-subunit alcohol dehydrogenase family)
MNKDGRYLIRDFRFNEEGIELKKKIAVVTGANRGIGFETVRQLAQKGVTVVLTARDEEKGEEAVRVLKGEGGDVRFHSLDVTDPDSIRRLSAYIRDTFGKLDILINNAGIFIDGDKTTRDVDMDTVRKTMETNFFGPFQVSQALIPLLMKSRDGRIVNVSSGLGALQGMGGGYPSYSISKTALNALTIKLAQDLASVGIKVNAMCPGWVRTDMGGLHATRSVEEGADTVVWLALSDHGATGKFFRDRKEIAW